MFTHRAGKVHGVMPTVTFSDYMRYFFTGYQVEGMSPSFLALLKTLQYIILVLVGSIVQKLYDGAVGGDFALNFGTFQGYIMPGVVVVLGFINELLRKALNPQASLAAIALATRRGARQSSPPHSAGMQEQPPPHS